MGSKVFRVFFKNPLCSTNTGRGESPGISEANKEEGFGRHIQPKGYSFAFVRSLLFICPLLSSPHVRQCVGTVAMKRVLKREESSGGWAEGKKEQQFSRI